MKKPRPRRGIFGGTFDPPHVGHLIIAEAARDQFRLGEVLWIPAQIPPHKMIGEVSSGQHRAEMTRLTIRNDSHFVFSDIELNRTGISYMVDTIEALQNGDPDVDFYLIIGGDSLCAFHTWHRPDEILDRVPLLVYDRPDFNTSKVERDVTARARFINAPTMNFSSTEIRRRVRSGQSIRYMVPGAVYDYIGRHKLYGTG